MADSTNMFKDCATVNDLEFEYMIRSSPENVSWDGERSYEDTQRAYANIKRQYEARLEEICPSIFR